MRTSEPIRRAAERRCESCEVTGDRFFAKGVAYNPRNEPWGPLRWSCFFQLFSLVFWSVDWLSDLSFVWVKLFWSIV